MTLVGLDEARRVVLDACPRREATLVPLGDALGRVTAEGVRATEAVPPFPNTAMDGFAVRAADTEGAPVRLEVVATLAAGASPDTAVGPGQAVRIMTGAPMPPGADAVVMVEATRTLDGGATVLVSSEAAEGDHVRRAGDDLAAGDEVVAGGTALGAGHLGVLASLGVDRVPVVAPVRVGVMSTGDELVEGPVVLRPGQIRDANRPALLSLCRLSGFEAVDMGVAPDDEACIAERLEEGLSTCDAVLTSGGVSMGDFDYVKVVLDQLSGGSMRWMQVAIRPAKPLAFGVVRGTPVFGLPGNPVSSLVSFELFARPALRQMTGHARPERPTVAVVADEDLRRRPDGKLHLVRVAASFGADGRVHVRSSGAQGSHQLRAMAEATALALLEDGEGVAAGATVPAMLLDGALDGTLQG